MNKKNKTCVWFWSQPQSAKYVGLYMTDCDKTFSNKWLTDRFDHPSICPNCKRNVRFVGERIAEVAK